MKIAVIALTRGGTETACNIGEALHADVFVKFLHQHNKTCTVFTEKLSELINEIYLNYQGFVLIMATGIAFRTFAPLIKSKDKDPALVVVDEKGQFAISLLSGHLGGANALTKEIAYAIGAIPVITTATDVNHKIAFDNVAKENGFVIENLELMQHISGAFVNGKKVALATKYPVIGELTDDITDYETDPQKEVVVISNKCLVLPEEHVLYLCPKNLVLGIGCRKNTPFEKIEDAFDCFMKETNYKKSAIRAMASVDLKKEEQGLLDLSNKYRIPFHTFTAETLNQFDAPDGTSDFVKTITGASSVCQSAALAEARNGKTVVKKTIVHGITFSLAEEETEIRL